MTRKRPPEPTHRPTTHTRRRLLAAGASVAAMALAGCAGDGTAETATDGPTAAASTSATATDAVGTFRLLVSDQPAAIEDFDALDVTFDRARVFRAGDDDDSQSDTTTETGAATDDDTATDSATGTEEGAAETATEGTATGTGNGTAGAAEDTPPSTTEAEEDDQADDDAAEDDDGNRGFTVIELDGATVDLTEVIGEKAIGVFEDDLPAGRYTKIELYATAVDGVVAGESVDVKIPPGKLMITKPFTVEAGGSVSFVFDIGVVKRGKAGGYILKPIIGESGVAGEDVDVDEVDEGGDDSGTGADDGAAPDDGDDAQARDGTDDGDDADETEPTDDDESDGPSNDETPTATATLAAEDG